MVFKRCISILVSKASNDTTLAADVSMLDVEHVISRFQGSEQYAKELAAMICPLVLVMPKKLAHTNDNEILLCIEVYNHKCSWVKNQEILVLGQQLLTELRDNIYCSTDEIMKLTKKHTPSGYFLIEDIFYNDLGESKVVDYSKPILDWIRESNKIATKNGNPSLSLLLSKPAKGVEKTFDLLSLLDKILPIYKEVIAELKEEDSKGISVNSNCLDDGCSLSCGRVETLSLFHALGKFHYNKRETGNTTVSGTSFSKERSRLDCIASHYGFSAHEIFGITL
ncbi:unnamed protein product [Lactuca saligna]|uniref:Uncharacterized protein n=1 Tax=Lactuca saligna TaxID=75948 RepID=A0AA35Z2Y5_LACSI|nr:unnamed protein product [Lactuca saligna]